jgi:hypothetical protein
MSVDLYAILFVAVAGLFIDVGRRLFALKEGAKEREADIRWLYDETKELRRRISSIESNQ